jgi:hypothetical protein
MGFITIVIDDLNNKFEEEYLVTIPGVGSGKIKGKEWTIDDVFKNLEEVIKKRIRRI